MNSFQVFLPLMTLQLGRVLLWVNFHISYNKIGLIKQADTKRNRTWLPRHYISSQASWNKWQEWKMIPLVSMKTQNHISQNLKLRLIPFLWQKRIASHQLYDRIRDMYSCAMSFTQHHYKNDYSFWEINDFVLWSRSSKLFECLYGVGSIMTS